MPQVTIKRFFNLPKNQTAASLAWN